MFKLSEDGSFMFCGVAVSFINLVVDEIINVESFIEIINVESFIEIINVESFIEIINVESFIHTESFIAEILTPFEDILTLSWTIPDLLVAFGGAVSVRRPTHSRFQGSLVSSGSMGAASFLLAIGIAICCQSLPSAQYVNGKAFYLRQYMECKGGKVFEIQKVQDIDQCKEACVNHNCAAINLFQLGEYEFMCEILAYVRNFEYQQGAACYVAY
ncbi:hypothetical protein QR680_002895 [Steinernema hermaphroditum]|uniref:Apple domain-containing protein n=1 Tax=Steinernema hermaphroditum TaxID=289476 RepID=A0AA39LIM1_9BILA|nr:hypothetical protein QR680_002895 [Steinernema hermaphroditum]